MSIISSKQFDKNLIKKLILLAAHIKENPESYRKKLKGKILTNLFFEPSTRTSASFQTAMIKLGGKIIHFNPLYSSIKKNESINDTIKIMGTFADIVVVRHPQSHIFDNIINETDSVLINAGDGDNEHPTQSLLDLLTIYYCNKEKNLFTYNILTKNGFSFNNLEITIVGDLKYGRTVHSLIYLLLNYDNVVFDYTKDKIAKYKQPKKIIFMSNLPRNSMGKVQKNKLRENNKSLFKS